MFPGDQHKIPGANLNPYEEKLISNYTASEIATLQAKLDQQLGPEFLSTRPGAGNTKVHYIQADKCINLANEVFGFNGWSSSIKHMEVDFLDQNKEGKWSVGISVTVRVILKDGTYHEDVGYGSMENGKSKALVFEKAKKEGTTDALKRALRNFGNVLGNCIYDKEYLNKVTRVKSLRLPFDEKRLHRHAEKSTAATLPEHNGRKSNPEQNADTVNHQSKSSKEVADEYGGDELDELDFFGDGAEYDELMPDEVATEVKARNSNTSSPGNTDSNMEAALKAPIMPDAQAPPAGKKEQGGAPNLQVQANPKDGVIAPNRLPQSMGSVITHPATPNNNTKPMGKVPPANQPNTRGQQSYIPAATSRLPNMLPNMPNPPHNFSSYTTKKPIVNEPRQGNSNLPSAASSSNNHPIGFFTGRAALNQDGEVKIDPKNAPSFDPHRPTTISRSAGIDHSKSAPIHKNNLTPSPAIRKQFEFPSLNPNRQIGLPPTRGGYRSPLPMNPTTPVTGAKRSADTQRPVMLPDKPMLGETPGPHLNVLNSATPTKRPRM